MRFSLLITVTLAATLASLAACGDDPAPIATVTSATPELLAPADDARDDLAISIRYDDGDGDLGAGIVEVHDCRGDGLVTMLPIPAIAPPDVVGDPITGELVLHVNDIGAIATAALPATCRDLGVASLAGNESVFCVILIDKAGHRGAGDCTAPIGFEM